MNLILGVSIDFFIWVVKLVLVLWLEEVNISVVFVICIIEFCCIFGNLDLIVLVKVRMNKRSIDGEKKEFDLFYYFNFEGEIFFISLLICG